MRKFLLVLKVLLFSCLIFTPIACFAAGREQSINYARTTLDSIIFWLAIAPEILNLILVLVSLYLMFDGVRRWGTNTSGAFSRSLIGLFMLHTSNLEISFLPYLALFLEIWLCARGFEARTAARLNAEKATAEAADAFATNVKEWNEKAYREDWVAQTERALNLKNKHAETTQPRNLFTENWNAETGLALRLDALFSPLGQAQDIETNAGKLSAEDLDAMSANAGKLSAEGFDAMAVNADELPGETAHAA